MTERVPSDTNQPATVLSLRVREQATRKLDAQRAQEGGIWTGIGVLGRIGWCVAAPTLIGILLGSTLDKHRPGAHSWTLTLLVAGLCVGCAGAWRWVYAENVAIHATNKTSQ